MNDSTNMGSNLSWMGRKVAQHSNAVEMERGKVVLMLALVRCLITFNDYMAAVCFIVRIL